MKLKAINVKILIVPVILAVIVLSGIAIKNRSSGYIPEETVTESVEAVNKEAVAALVEGETKADIEDIKESIMETSEALEITAQDYKDAKDIEDIMKRIIDKTS